MNDTFDKLCSEIEDNFDFSKVASVMKFLNWEIFDKGSSSYIIPTESELKSIAHTSLKRVYEEILEQKCEMSVIASGPFETIAFYNKDTSKVDIMFLKFICEEFGSYIE